MWAKDRPVARSSRARGIFTFFLAWMVGVNLFTNVSYQYGWLAAMAAGLHPDPYSEGLSLEGDSEPGQ